MGKKNISCNDWLHAVELNMFIRMGGGWKINTCYWAPYVYYCPFCGTKLNTLECADDY